MPKKIFDSIRMDVVRLPDGHWTSQDSQTWGSQLRELITPERLWVSGDWGAAAPSWFGLFLQTPADMVVNGIRIGAHSLICLDEWHSARREMSGEICPDLGILTPTPLAAGHVRQLCQRWGVELSQIPIRQRIADAAIFAAHGSISGSIGDELRAAGRLSWAPPGGRAGACSGCGGYSLDRAREGHCRALRPTPSGSGQCSESKPPELGPESGPRWTRCDNREWLLGQQG